MAAGKRDGDGNAEFAKRNSGLGVHAKQQHVDTVHGLELESSGIW